MIKEKSLIYMIPIIMLWAAVTIILILAFSSAARGDELHERREVAMTIAAEAGGEGFHGMYCVACTIANRARQRNMTPFQIVSQKSQYYGYAAKNREALYAHVKTDADWLAENIMSIIDITGGAVFFRRPDEPMFRWCRVETYRYRNHIFYK